MRRSKQRFLTLFCILLFSFCVVLTACGSKCEHAYDNACDTACNECGEAREASAHQYKDADCGTPRTCTVCGWSDGTKKGHTPNEDDGGLDLPIDRN